MASGLDMVYEAIGGAGGELSGYLKAAELRRLQEEADRIAQADRDALTAEYQKSMSDLDLQMAEYGQKAQSLGIQLPAAGSIDEQIFRATGGLGMPPLRRSIGAGPGAQGGTQLPASRTEWAPSSAEAAVSADMVNASRDILSGRPAVDPTAYRKRLELLNGLALKAASRPSTSSMVAQFNKNAESGSDFMTREGAIANDARARQGSLAGMLMGGRAQAARDKQHLVYAEGQQNARSAAQIASSERMAKDRLKADEKKEQRLVDKEDRLRADLMFRTFVQAGKFDQALQVAKFQDMKDLEEGKISEKAFLLRYPGAKIDSSGLFGKKVVGVDMEKEAMDLERQLSMIPGVQQHIANMIGDTLPTPSAPAIPMQNANRGYAPQAYFGSAPTPVPKNLPNLNDPNKPRVF